MLHNQEREDEDCSIWQHMMDSRYHLKIAANLSNDWGPPLAAIRRSQPLGSIQHTPTNGRYLPRSRHSGPYLSISACGGLIRNSPDDSSQPHRQRPVAAQHIVIVEIFVTQRRRVYPLRHQRPHVVLDALPIGMAGKASRKSIQQPDTPKRNRPASNCWRYFDRRSPRSLP